MLPSSEGRGRLYLLITALYKILLPYSHGWIDAYSDKESDNSNRSEGIKKSHSVKVTREYEAFCINTSFSPPFTVLSISESAVRPELDIPKLVDGLPQDPIICRVSSMGHNSVSSISWFVRPLNLSIPPEQHQDTVWWERTKTEFKLKVFLLSFSIFRITSGDYCKQIFERLKVFSIHLTPVLSAKYKTHIKTMG